MCMFSFLLKTMIFWSMFVVNNVIIKAYDVAGRCGTEQYI